MQLAPSAALSLAMALHELATNAAKYGALSNEQGHVSITWQIKGGGEERRLHMRWAEQGGPLVVPPTRKGFGSLLVGRDLPQELRGDVQIDSPILRPRVHDRCANNERTLVWMT